MRAKRLVIAASLILLLGGGAASIFGPSREPAFKGRKLSEWVTDYGRSRIDKIRDWEAEEAIREIGPVAIPWLMDWLENKEPSIAARSISALGKEFSDHPAWDLTYLNQHRADSAAMAFAILGTNAQAVVPELFQRLVTSEDEYRASQAAKVLGNIGGITLPPLLRVLTNQSHIIRERAALAIFYMAPTNTSPATGALIRALSDSDNTVVALACSTLSRARTAPEAVVPILTRMLTNDVPARRSMAAEALGRYSSIPKATAW